MDNETKTDSLKLIGNLLVLIIVAGIGSACWFLSAGATVETLLRIIMTVSVLRLLK